MAEIDKLMSRTGTDEVTGDEAAALATLKGALPALAKLVPAPFWRRDGVDTKALAEYERLYQFTDALPFEIPAADKQGVKVVVTTENEFVARKARLVKILKGNNVIAPNSKPLGPVVGGLATYVVPDGPAGATNQDPNKVAQGAAGDCAFLATTIAMLGSRGPTAAQFEIRVNVDPKNTQYAYSVKFPGLGDKIYITKPTQSEMALYANAGENGLWLSILEKAYGDYRRRTFNLGENVTFFGAFFSKDTYSFLEGQSLPKAMKAVTGREPAVYLTRNKLTVAAVDKALKGLIGNTADAKGFSPLKVTVTAATFGVDNYTPDDRTALIPGHAYAVVGYDAKNGKLRITNPWNNSAYTYGTTFDTMTVNEFCKKFGAICIESRAGVNAQP